MVTKSLTVVLPIHNGESRLRSQVRELLEVASDLTTDFKILIFDDGSTDSTYEVAEDLVARYPQVRIRRHRHRRGLGPVIDYVRRNVRSDAVLFHDGVTQVDCNQMRTVWHRWIARFQTDNKEPSAPDGESCQVCDFENLPAIHSALERVHGELLGFHLIVLQHETSDAAHDEELERSATPRADDPHLSRPAGIGGIPRLPRPKLLAALAEFAIGE